MDNELGRFLRKIVFSRDHLCRIRNCVNPLHLEPVDHSTNIARGGNAAKTHCKQGHEFTEKNIIHAKLGRECRTCKYARNAERKRRLRRVKRGE